MQDEALRDEFTHQAVSFGDSPAMSSAETLGALAELVPEDAEARWLDLACGPGLVTRAIAGRVGSVLGVDLTPAMVERAERLSREQPVGEVSFALGDATATGLDEAAVDGAITRFSFHHVPAPRRVLAEMARVVRPGGCVVVGDQVTDESAEGMAWHQEIERLRDPTHWLTQRVPALRAMGESLGLELEAERLVPIELDYEEWLARGSGGPGAAELIDELLAARPQGAESFAVFQGPDGRRLRQRYWLGRWRRGG